MRVALGTAIVMGLSHGRMDTAPTTAHLLVGGECNRSCTYCNVRDSRIARIAWPEFPDEAVLNSSFSDFNRACLQLTGNDINDAMKIIPKIPVSVSVSLNTHNSSDIDRLFAAGADRVCLPLDASTLAIARSVNRDDFDQTMMLLERSSKEHAGKISTHIIMGLGETEKETVDIIQKMYEIGVRVALFAFTPVKGSPFESRPRPHKGGYRRVQIAKYLIELGESKIGFGYNKRSQIVDVLIDCNNAIKFTVVPGKAFQTSGCPDCNRPCFDSPASEPYNYPRALSNDELKDAMHMSCVYLGTCIHKADKLIKIRLEYSNIIESLTITGDFFIYPEDALHEIERRLIGCRIVKLEIRDKIANALSGVEAFGFDTESLTDAIMGAVA